MYGGDVDKAASLDPYADPPPAEASAPLQSMRSNSRSRSRSPMRGHRSPRHRSPPPFSSRRSPGARRQNGAPEAPKPSKVLGVFGLSIRTVERDLEDEFSRYGNCEKVTIVYDQRSGRSRGFGFIQMSNLDEAAACIEKLNGVELQGRRIRVDYSVTDRPHNPTPGEYMGIRRDERDRDRRRYRDDYDRDRDRYRGSRYDDRDRDYHRDRDYREKDRDREYRDYRDRRSPRGGRYSPSPPPRNRRRSYSRSPRARRDEGHGEGERGSKW